jgi:hypothetical protein
MFALKRIEVAKLAIPVRFECVCNQAIVGIDLQIAAACEFRLIPGAL